MFEREISMLHTFFDAKYIQKVGGWNRDVNLYSAM